jgi:hypothetical protein
VKQAELAALAWHVRVGVHVRESHACGCLSFLTPPLKRTAVLLDQEC